MLQELKDIYLTELQRYQDQVRYLIANCYVSPAHE